MNFTDADGHHPIIFAMGACRGSSGLAKHLPMATARVIEAAVDANRVGAKCRMQIKVGKDISYAPLAVTPNSLPRSANVDKNRLFSGFEHQKVLQELLPTLSF
jgi:hypothetical protein